MIKFNQYKFAERILTIQSYSSAMLRYNIIFRNSYHGLGLHKGMLLNRKYDSCHRFSTSAKCNNQFSNFNKKTNTVNSNNSKINNFILQTILNIISVVFIVFVVYKFYTSLTLVRLYAFIATLIISFLISSFISNKYSYSKNKLVRVLQKFVIYFFILIFGVVVCDYLDIKLLPEAKCDSDDESDTNNNTNTGSNNSNDNTNADNSNTKSDSNIKFGNTILKATIQEDGTQKVYNVIANKEIADNLISGASKVVTEGVKEVAPFLGAAAAGAKLGSTAFQSTAGLPVVQRLAISGAAIATGSSSAMLGLEGGKTLIKNLKDSEAIKISKSNTQDSDNDSIPSPTETFINCPLEEGDNNIPLIYLLNILFSLNVIEFLFLILLVLILYNKYINKINITIISNFINKYMSKKVINWYNKYSQTSLKFSEKFSKYLFIYVSFMLIFTKLISLIFIFDLNYHIEDYVLVYNHYKGIDKNSLILLSCSNKIFFKNSQNITGFSPSNFSYFNLKNKLINGHKTLNSTIERKVFKLVKISILINSFSEKSKSIKYKQNYGN